MSTTMTDSPVISYLSSLTQAMPEPVPAELAALQRMRVPRPGMKYATEMALVLAEGQHFGADKVIPSRNGFRRQHECFRNALLTAQRDGLLYAEGWAQHGVMPVHHAWCVTGDGNVVDPTWQEVNRKYGHSFEDSDYLGVVFDPRLVWQFIVKHTGRYGLFEDYGQHHFLEHGAEGITIDCDCRTRYDHR